MYKKYGKSLQDILRIKGNFFTEDNALVADNISMADIYIKQKKRLSCKNCDSPLGTEEFF